MSIVLRNITIYIILLGLSLLVLPKSFAKELSSEAVIEQSTQRILHQVNGDVKLPMASTTKIMTAIIAIENCSPDDLVIIPKEAQGVEGSSIYLKAGDSYTVRDLLYGLMLRSGNDSAVALAIHTAGSVQNFVKLMNDKAKELGAYDTNFSNPHGLHDNNHYTTAIDLANITAYAYKNNLFRKIVGSKSYKLKDNVIYNKNKLLSQYDGADGVKTGYTMVAGRCLVSSSTRNGMQVICVVLNCYDMWERSKKLMDNAHSNFSMAKVIDKNDKFETIVENGAKDNTFLSAKTDKYYPLSKGEDNKITYKTNILPMIAPIYDKKSYGNLEVYFDNHLIFKENIYTIECIERKSLIDSLFD